MNAERTKLQQLFIRVCRDSGFSIEATRAASIGHGLPSVHTPAA